MARTIRLKEALRAMDDHSEPFAVAFFTHDSSKKKESKLIVLPAAVKCGLKANMIENGLIGITVPGNNDHPYAVHTWLLQQFNGLNVII